MEAEDGSLEWKLEWKPRQAEGLSRDFQLTLWDFGSELYPSNKKAKKTLENFGFLQCRKIRPKSADCRFYFLFGTTIVPRKLSQGYSREVTY
jgi:hypothetical protein